MDLGQMPRHERRLHFICGGNEGDRIRGADYFEAQTQLIPDRVRVDTALQLEQDRCGLYIVLMPASPGIADALEHVQQKRCPCRSIVDVHADVWNPHPSLHEWWRQPEQINALERCVRAADVVTVPETFPVEVVEQFNRNVVVVPDLVDDSDEAAMALARGWLEAMSIASNHTH